MKRLLPGLLIVSITSAASAADNSNLEPPMVRIAPGSFYMGSNYNKFQIPVHQVSIGYAFEIGKTEVTQGQWKAVMGNNPSKFANCGDNCPVEQVNWDDAQAFIEKLNANTGKKYRLPSEAEWEYACRAGGNDEYCGGSDAGKVAWYEGNSGGKTSSVAQKKPNAWGLYDMSGNVWEWAQDCLSENYAGAPADGSAREMRNDCGRRVLRGGAWGGGGGVETLRSANRGGVVLGKRYNNVGFRVARTLP